MSSNNECISPVTKLKKFYDRIRKVDPSSLSNREIKEILLDKNLINGNKLDQIQMKVKQTPKELKVPKRTKILLFVLASILFLFGGGPFLGPGNVGVFAALMGRRRASLGR